MGFKLSNDWVRKRFEMHIKTNTRHLEGIVEAWMLKDALRSLPRSEVSSLWLWLVPLPVGCVKARTSWQEGATGENCSSCDS